MKKLNFFDKILFTINMIFSILLLTSYVVPHIDPEKYPSIAILSLGYPVLLIINIVFMILWMIKLKFQFILSVIAILVGYNHVFNFYAIEEKEIIKESDIKLLSFNVRGFNVAKYINAPNIRQNIYEFINDKQPDIICTQESRDNKNVKINIPKIYQHKNSGLTIYAKYPMVNKPNFLFKEYGNNVIYVDLKIKNEIIRVYNVHFQSFRLDPNKENYGGFNKTLVKKFKDVFKKQARQVKVLKQHIDNCKYRTIVVGDFNNTAFSWNYNEIMENRKDAFVEAGTNFGRSYHYFFPFRIDFILPDNTMEVGKFTTYNVNLSDHFPIMARINLNN